jgi:hypothetical protein
MSPNPRQIAQRVAEVADFVTVALDALLPRTDGPEHLLNEAMRYAALGCRGSGRIARRLRVGMHLRL